MNDINTLFFELIQVALGVRVCLSHSPTATEWKQLYDIAKKQSLVGVCFAGVQKLVEQQQTPEEMLYLTWMGMAAKIQQRNETVNRQCVELQKKLADDGFRSYIMKGQAVGSLYRVDDCKKRGETSTGGSDPAVDKNVENRGSLQILRQSGDIDVYLEGGLDKVLAYAKTFGNVEHVNELEMSVPIFQDTEVEFHYRPMVLRDPIKNRRLQQYFDENAEVCFANSLKLSADSLEIKAPTNAFNLVHQLVHIYLHFITGGVGLRQLMDYYFVLRASELREDCLELREVKEVIGDLGLRKFAAALMWVIAYVFEGNDSKLCSLSSQLFDSEPCEDDGRVLLNEIMISGNFGHTDERMADIATNKWTSFWFINGKTFRFWRFDHWAWFWSPLWRIYHFLWRKMKGFA